MICQFLIFLELQRNECFRKKALDLSFGKVLDVGAGAGSHSFIFKMKKIRGYSFRYFPKSIEICKARGVKNAICEDLLQCSEKDFDTILLLMNGTGFSRV
jgi:hypothetical protein